jgi:BatD DUF11 like domain
MVLIESKIMDAWMTLKKSVIEYSLMLLAMLALLSVGVRPVAAEEFFKAQISNQSPNLGDALVYTIEVMTSGDTQYSPDITPPDLRQYFQVGETFGRSSVSILNGKTHIVTTKEIHLVANNTGEIQIEPAQIELIDTATNQRVMRQTNSVTLAVNEATGSLALPTPTPEIDVLKPIKKGAKLSLSQWLPFAVGGFIILAMFGVMFYIKHKPEPKPKEEIVIEDSRSPEERAFEALEEAMRYKEEGMINEFYTALSVALRHYMSETFEFKAEEATTREMLREMEKMEFKPDFLEKYREYFIECDKVKFANIEPEAQKIESVLPAVKDLIQHPDKRDVPEPPPEEETPADGEEALEPELTAASQGPDASSEPTEKS